MPAVFEVIRIVNTLGYMRCNGDTHYFAVARLTDKPSGTCACGKVTVG